MTPQSGNQVSTSLGNSGLCWTVSAWNRDTAVPAEGNRDLQTLICVLVARPRRSLTLLNPVPWQNWMAAYLGCTPRMRTLFRGWPIIVKDMHTRRKRPLSSSITPSLFHSRLKTYLFNKFFHIRLFLPTGLPSWQRDWIGPIMLIVLFLVSLFNFLFVPCGGPSWLPVSFLLHVKYTLSYRIVSCVYRTETDNVKQYDDNTTHTVELDWSTENIGNSQTAPRQVSWYAPSLEDNQLPISW